MARHKHSHSHSHSHSHGGGGHDAPTLPEVHNLLGATVFFAYILAALLFTALIIGSLRRTYHRLPPSHRPTTHILTLTILALSSFITLSYHMLLFLLHSYTAWSSINALPLSTVASRHLTGGIFPTPTGLTNFLIALTTSVRQWSLASSLFTDFATSLVSSPGSQQWTTASLSYSLCLAIWMADTAHRYGIPRWGYYFVIAQILPVSFAQHLFSLAVVMARASPEGKVAESVPSQTRANHLVYAALLVGYVVLLGRLPRFVGSEWLLVMVGVVRAALAAPAVVPWVTRMLGCSTELRFVTVMEDAGPFLGGGLLVVGYHWWRVGAVKLLEAVQSRPAVGALGYDMVIGLVGLGACRAAGIIGGNTVESGIDQENGQKCEELQGKVDDKLRGAKVPGHKSDGDLQESLERKLKARSKLPG